MDTTATFVLDKETKNTHRYAEVPEEGEAPAVGSLYVQKHVAQRLGNPETITVRITAHEAG